ncbi:MAG: HD domain-containing protein [Planctomycetes bacterium]|nr:HD domain-containing protein [Planctomycetota bacterium]
MSDFWLVSVAGTKEAKHRLAPPGPITIGRGTDRTIILAEKVVSRHHATLHWSSATVDEPGMWRISDDGSSAGTYINGAQVQAGRTLPLRHGDRLEISPWTFEVVDQEVPLDLATMIDVSSGEEKSRIEAQVERVQIAEPAAFAQDQLLILLQAGESIHQAEHEAEVYPAVVHALAMATQFANVAFVRNVGQGDAVEVLTQIGEMKDAQGRPRISRSMLRQARQGPVIEKAFSAADPTLEANPNHTVMPKSMEVRRAICVPVELAGVLFGFLYLDDAKPRDDARLAEVASIAGAIARMAAQGLGNQQRVRMAQRFAMEQQLMFGGTMHALISAIDAKDPYTRGHSVRVARFARLLAQAAGLGVELVERTHLCGTVHDIGKIGVPEAVLCKAERLTDDEFAKITAHPATGFQILRDIPQMRDVLHGVLEHHEKWDGSGYPNGLVGDKISLLGRIICLADCFDAMTSARVYRPARSVEEVQAEMQKCLGRHFDPELGKIFLSIPRLKLQEQIVRSDVAASGSF